MARTDCDSDAEAPHSDLTPRAAAEQTARREREAAALRENLRRRKEQARARQDPPPAPKPDLPGDLGVG